MTPVSRFGVLARLVRELDNGWRGSTPDVYPSRVPTTPDERGYFRWSSLHAVAQETLGNPRLSQDTLPGVASHHRRLASILTIVQTMILRVCGTGTTMGNRLLCLGISMLIRARPRATILNRRYRGVASSVRWIGAGGALGRDVR